MNKDQVKISRKMTFTEFSESCRSKFAETQSGLRDHEGNRLLEKVKSKKQLKSFGGNLSYIRMLGINGPTVCAYRCVVTQCLSRLDVATVASPTD